METKTPPEKPPLSLAQKTFRVGFEGGRAFLAGLLNQLTDDQLRDLFETARVPERLAKGGAAETDKASAEVDEWIRVFKAKRSEVSATHCPA